MPPSVGGILGTVGGWFGAGPQSKDDEVRYFSFAHAESSSEHEQKTRQSADFLPHFRRNQMRPHTKTTTTAILIASEQAMGHWAKEL